MCVDVSKVEFHLTQGAGHADVVCVLFNNNYVFNVNSSVGSQQNGVHSGI